MRPEAIEFDVSTDPLSRDGRPLGPGAKDPRGRRLTANRYYLTMEDEPYPVVAGELLPQRYPVQEWPDAVRALRDAGCTMVSAYVFWGLIEPQPGRFDFTGANDIRTFATLCAELGLTFTPRIGPFNNSEYLVGGLPPWLFGKPVVERSDDPGYLALVRRYFAAVSEQFRGLYFSDGGPILAVQLENELAHAPNDWSTLFGYTASEHRGPTGEAFTRHMATLRAIALEEGIRPPFFSMTGWRTAGEVPEGKFLTGYGAYMDLHPRPGSNLRLTTFFSGDYPYRGRYPVTFCELGTGSPHRAAYRSRTPAEATLTTAITRMGSVESIYLGYYLFHGGTNPVRGDGFGWTPKEATFAQRSYDFWAPVSEFGERRDSYYELVPLNHLIREFGADLADLPVVEPVDPVLDPDSDRLRSVMRASRDRGFVFLSNYGNNIPLSDRDDVRLVIRGEDRIELPRRGELAVASGANLVLPIGLDVGQRVRVSATAQPVARLGGPAEPAVVFASEQSEVEYLIDAALADVTPPSGARLRVEPHGVSVIVPVGAAGPIVVSGAAGSVRLVTITMDAARHSQVTGAGSQKALVTCPEDFTIDGEIVTVSRRRQLGEADAIDTEVVTITAASTRRQLVQLPAPVIQADAIRTVALSPSRVVVRAIGVADAVLPSLWADIEYTGDLCRMFDIGTGIMEADNFHHGQPWRVKIGRFAAALAGEGLQLRAEPLARREEVDDPDGILIDSAIVEHSPAHIDSVTVSQRVQASTRIPV